MRRKQDGEIPLKSIFCAVCARTHRIVGIDIDVSFLTGAAVKSRQKSVVASRENNVRIFGMRSDPSGFAAADREPIACRDRKTIRTRGYADRRIILLGSINVVRKIVVGGDAVKLRRRLILLRPTGGAVNAHVCTAIVSVDHPVWVIRTDPKIMIVTVRNADIRKSASAVDRSVKPDIEDVNRIFVSRIRVNPIEIPGPLPNIGVIANFLPSFAAVVRSKKPALFGLDHRP